MRKWLSMEMTLEEWMLIRPFVRQNKIKYEASECYGNVHIEAYVTSAERQMVNGYIDRVIA